MTSEHRIIMCVKAYYYIIDIYIHQSSFPSGGGEKRHKTKEGQFVYFVGPRQRGLAARLKDNALLFYLRALQTQNPFPSLRIPPNPPGDLNM